MKLFFCYFSSRNLEQSRVEEVTELMEKMTPKSKDAFVNARIKEKQEQEKKVFRYYPLI